MMRKAIVLIIASIVPLLSSAQRNPVTGYIITNGNDTIHGTIDYLNDAENCQRCVFSPEGVSEYRTYSPTDIKAYRFSNDGIFYVSRNFPVGQAEKTVFAEYLLQGGVSLYRYTETEDHYFFVGEDGQVMMITDDHLEKQDEHFYDKVKQRGKMLVNGMEVFEKDADVIEKLYRIPYNAENLTQIVRNYDEKYCTDSGDCIQFQYDAKKSARYHRHFRVEAGCEYLHVNSGESDIWGPKIGIGAEISSARHIAPPLSWEAMISVGMCKHASSHTDEDNKTDDDWLQTNVLVEMSFGALYRLNPEKKHTAILKGGIVLPQFACVGVYAGAGYEWTAGSHRMQLSLTGSAAKVVVNKYFILSGSLNFAFVL